eukprot:gene6602-biopygen13756
MSRGGRLRAESKLPIPPQAWDRHDVRKANGKGHLKVGCG